MIATQNPVEFHGTYPLPEAQLDRFAMKLSLGYVSAEEEVKMLQAQGQSHPLSDLTACINQEDIVFIQQQVKQVYISPELLHYIVALVEKTRSHEIIKLGASPRASLTLMRCSQALALIEGLDFVTPDIIQELAVVVIAHRLGLETQSRFSGQSASALVEDLLNTVAIPV